MKFVDLFAGLGGFHIALRELGHECVFVSELDENLQRLYRENFPESHAYVHGDIRECRHKIPPHDILCAGFPCQPFSKSGSQRGLRDKTRGTLFHEIAKILEEHKPPYVILENVGNFERHDNGRTWRIVRAQLQELGYSVRGTEHVTSGGSGLLSPHHLGYPHTRERFFIVASTRTLSSNPFPMTSRKRVTRLSSLVRRNSSLSKGERAAAALTAQQIECIDHWNALLKCLPERMELPSFPIWADESGATYPFEKKTPFACTRSELQKFFPRYRRGYLRKTSLLNLLPPYAQTREPIFPGWKVKFIRQNREWFRAIRPYIPRGWVRRLRSFPNSLRKLEWNCKGEDDLLPDSPPVRM